MQLPIYYSTAAQPSFNQREFLGHLTKKSTQSFTLFVRILTLSSICLNFEIPNTVCRSHELFLVHQEGHFSIASTAVLGNCLTTSLCLTLVLAELKSVES